jgi:hypothetical protein
MPLYRTEKPLQGLIGQAEMAAERLAHLTPDSAWARRASGCRGSLLRILERLYDLPIDGELSQADIQALEQVLARSFEILVKAARERLRNEASATSAATNRAA